MNAYKVFMICPNGHVIQLSEYKCEENAVIDAQYQFQWCGLSGVRFEVCVNGNTVYASEVLG